MVNGVLYSPKYNYIAYYCTKSGCSSLKHLFIDLHKEELPQDVQSQLISHTDLNFKQYVSPIVTQIIVH